MPVLNAEAQPICRTFRARARESLLFLFSLAASKLLYLHNRSGDGCTITLPSSPPTISLLKVYIRSFVLLRTLAKRARVSASGGRAQTRAGVQYDSVYGKGRDAGKRGIQKEKCRFGRCFFASQFLRVRGRLDEREVKEGGGGPGILSFGPIVCEPAARSAYQTRPSFSLLVLSPSPFPRKAVETV